MDTAWIAAIAGIAGTILGGLVTATTQYILSGRQAKRTWERQDLLRQRDRLLNVKTEALDGLDEFISVCTEALTRFRRPFASMSEEDRADVRYFAATLNTVQTSASISVSAAGMAVEIGQVILAASERLAETAVQQMEGKDMTEEAYEYVLKSLVSLKNAYMNAKAADA